MPKKAANSSVAAPKSASAAARKIGSQSQNDLKKITEEIIEKNTRDVNEGHWKQLTDAWHIPLFGQYWTHYLQTYPHQDLSLAGPDSKIRI